MDAGCVPLLVSVPASSCLVSLDLIVLHHLYKYMSRAFLFVGSDATAGKYAFLQVPQPVVE